jgi:Domain of unknown function (DUF1902)
MPMPKFVERAGNSITNRAVHIKAVWDGDAHVWVAESTDVPGLITEADSDSRLIEKLSFWCLNFWNSTLFT